MGPKKTRITTKKIFKILFENVDNNLTPFCFSFDLEDSDVGGTLAVELAILPGRVRRYPILTSLQARKM